MERCGTVQNKTSAKQWLNKSWHHFSSASILYEVNHYTDVIAVDLHYAVETSLKSFYAYENKKIIKTHDLIEISQNLKEKISFNLEEKELMILITTYHIRGSYPVQDRKMPSRDEIKLVLEFADELFKRVCKILDIDILEVRI